MLTIPLLDPTLVNPSIGWRLAFGLGAVLAVGVLLVRRNVPESPRWLFIHGREREGDRIVAEFLEILNTYVDSHYATQYATHGEPAAAGSIPVPNSLV